MPNVVGLDRKDAEDTLKRAGFEVIVQEVENGDVDKDEVFDQFPRADDMAQEGDEVTILVAVEPKRGKGQGDGDG